MCRYLSFATLTLLVLLLAAPLPTAAAESEALRSRWEREALSLAQWAPDITYDAATGLVEFTGAEGRRLRASIVFPSGGAAGTALHLGRPAAMAGDDGLAHMYLPTDMIKPRIALLDAYRALSVLLSAPGVLAGKVALVGQGEGAALAVALAGLRPGEVGCVVALDPQSPARGRGRWDLAGFATLVRCPTLLVATRSGGTSVTMALLAQSLAGPVEVAAVADRPQATWQGWVAQALAQQARPARLVDRETGYAPGLPVDLSDQ